MHLLKKAFPFHPVTYQKASGKICGNFFHQASIDRREAKERDIFFSSFTIDDIFLLTFTDLRQVLAIISIVFIKSTSLFFALCRQFTLSWLPVTTVLWPFWIIFFSVIWNLWNCIINNTAKGISGYNTLDHKLTFWAKKSQRRSHTSHLFELLAKRENWSMTQPKRSCVLKKSVPAITWRISIGLCVNKKPPLHSMQCLKQFTEKSFHKSLPLGLLNASQFCSLIRIA